MSSLIVGTALQRLRHQTFPQWAAYGAVAFIVVAAWWSYSSHLELVAAWQGFTPLGYVYHFAKAENFARDFPSGIELVDSSLFMRFYKWAYLLLGITPEILQPWAVGLEILVLVLAVLCLMRVIKPHATPVAVVLVVALVVGSAARNMNLARFGQPFFVGQYYNVADACRIGAVVFAIKRKPVGAALLMALAFMCHPMLGLMGMVFVAAVLLQTWRELTPGPTVLGLALFVLLAGGWTLATVDASALTGGGIPDHAWFALTRMGSFHWFPVDYGVFTTKHGEGFVPFLSFLVLLLFYFPGKNSARQVDKQIAAGLFAMAGLAMIGVAISVLRPNQMLVKLALHRANDLILLIGLVYVADGLLREVRAGLNWRALVAGAVLASPFVMRPGVPVLLSLLLVMPVLVRLWSRGQKPDGREVWAAVLALSCVTLIAIYWGIGMAEPWDSDTYTGVVAFLRRGSLGWLTLIAILGIVSVERFRPGLATPLALTLIVVATCGFVYGQRPLKNPGIRQQASDYFEAQVWARKNTAPDSLFMPPPGYHYGWRDVSRRSSFGDLREWLHSGWFYNSNGEAYGEGMRRFSEFGIDLEPYLGYSPPMAGAFALSAEVRRLYHTRDAEWFEGLAREYCIDYFVYLTRVRKVELDLPVVFQNPTVTIVKAPWRCSSEALRDAAWKP